MNTTDKITELLKKGVVSLNLGQTKEGALFLQAGQVVPTGPGPEDHMQLTHQVADLGLPELLEHIEKQVNHANALKTNLIQFKKGGRN